MHYFIVLVIIYVCVKCYFFVLFCFVSSWVFCHFDIDVCYSTCIFLIFFLIVKRTLMLIMYSAASLYIFTGHSAI